MQAVDIRDLSGLECTCHVYDDGERYVRILVVAFAGDYGVGSAGNGDGVFIQAETVRAVVACDPSALVLDFRKMRYSWGNTLLAVFQTIDRLMNEEGEPAFPVLVVTSDLCRDAVLSLLGGKDSDKWHFGNIDDALDAAVDAADAWLDA